MFVSILIGNCNESLIDIVRNYGPDYPIAKITQPKIVASKIKDLEMLDSIHPVILNAQSILDLYATRALQTGEVILSDFYCFPRDEIYVVLDVLVEITPSKQQESETANNQQPLLHLKSETTVSKHVRKL